MTTSSLEMILHGVNILRGALRVLNSAEDLAHKDIPNTTKIAAIAARVLGLGFSVYETNAVMHHASTEELMRIKELELFEKVFEFGTCVAVAKAKCENPDPRKTRQESMICLSEEEILASGLDILRVFNQKMIYTEKYFLEVPSDYSPDDPHLHYHDENSVHPIIDVDKHNKNIAIGQNLDLLQSFIGAYLETRPFKTNLEQKLSHQRENTLEAEDVNIYRFEHLAELNVPICVRLSELRQEKQKQNIENLLSLSFIPSHFYENDPDSVFKRYECSLSLMPARHPVKDPTARGTRKVIYDEVNILEYLDRLAKEGLPMQSPITREPLHPRDLIPMPGAQRLIDTRLSGFQQKWNKILEIRPELKALPTEIDERDLIEAAFRELNGLNPTHTTKN